MVTTSTTNSTESCGNCRFCLYIDIHECHRHPPTLGLVQGQWMSEWPAVRPSDWCGEWELLRAVPKGAV
jgi:hypothetical protein